MQSAVAAVAEVVPESAKARWEIRGFSYMDKSKEVCMESPTLVEVVGMRFFIKAYWGGVAEAQDGYVSLFCHAVGQREEDVVMIRFHFRIFGQGGTLVRELGNTSEGERIPYRRGRGWPDFCELGYLQRHLEGGDSFFLELDLTAWRPDQVQVRRLPAAPESSSGVAVWGVADQTAGTLGEDLVAFLAEGRATDVELSGALSEAGETTVRAHRVVLAARSPVFSRMLLESGMRESQAGARISLDGADAAIVERFVRFLYKDELDKESIEDSDALCHLLALGHRYEVQSLVRRCTAHLTVTEGKAIELLMMSEQLGIGPLKEQVMDFICACRERLVHVQQTEAFDRLVQGHPQLVKELFAQATRSTGKKRKRASKRPP